MLNIKECLSAPGNPNRCNEDYVGYGDKFMFVLDGASGLSGVNVMAESDAAWFATSFGSQLIRELSSKKSMITPYLMEGIIGKLRGEYKHTIEKLGISEPKDSPSAGIALFRVSKTKLEFFGLGDCVGVVKFKSGEVRVLADDKLSALDGAVLKHMRKLREDTGIDIINCRDLCKDLLLENRSKRNTSEGYGVLDLDRGCIKYARRESFDLDDVEEIYAFTDGFTQLVEVFKHCKDYKELCEAIDAGGLALLYTELWEAQQLDSKCNNYPRFKLRDDTSAVCAVLK